RDRSVAEAARETGEKPNTTLRRVRRFVDMGLLRVWREVPRAGRPVKRYRAVADVFFVPFDATGAESLEAALAGRDAYWERLVRRVGGVGRLGRARVPRRPRPPASPDRRATGRQRHHAGPQRAGRAVALARRAHARLRGRQGAATRDVRVGAALSTAHGRPALRRADGPGAGPDRTRSTADDQIGRASWTEQA